MAAPTVAITSRAAPPPRPLDPAADAAPPAPAAVPVPEAGPASPPLPGPGTSVDMLLGDVDLERLFGCEDEDAPGGA